MSAPKVILIGGPPMVGKSSVARVAAAKLGYGCTSTDDIGLAIRTVTTAQTHPWSHAMDGIDYREYYIARSVEQLLADAMGMHEEMWPGIEAGIRAHSTWSFPIVYEGWALWPERVVETVRELENVSAVWLTASDELMEARVRNARRFYAGASDEEMMISKFLPRNIEYNNRMLDTLERLGLSSIEILRADSIETVVEKCFAEWSS
ncbi:MAG: hypothetical protein O3B95_00280 [Chloroflexi bacterium]|nr:hypothetical protein [Chloroflexota bacterium]